MVISPVEVVATLVIFISLVPVSLAEIASGVMVRVPIVLAGDVSLLEPAPEPPMFTVNSPAVIAAMVLFFWLPPAQRKIWFFLAICSSWKVLVG